MDNLKKIIATDSEIMIIYFNDCSNFERIFETFIEVVSRLKQFLSSLLAGSVEYFSKYPFKTGAIIICVIS